MVKTTISSAELGHLWEVDPSVRIVDVRSPGEYESAHIPGSLNIPLDILGSYQRQLVSLDGSIVFVCQSGARAANAHGTLVELGNTRCLVLEGGLTAWAAAGGAVDKGRTHRWAMDRQVRLFAGSLVLGGVLMSWRIPKAKWLSAAVGGGLVFSAVSNSCAMANVLARLPYNQAEGRDIDGVFAELSGETV